MENFWHKRARSDPHEEGEDRVSLEDLSPQHGFSKATFYKWEARYGGMDVSALKRLKELEEENRRLKQMYADWSPEHQALKDIVEKSYKTWRTS